MLPAISVSGGRSHPARCFLFSAKFPESTVRWLLTKPGRSLHFSKESGLLEGIKAAKMKGFMEKGKLGARRGHGADRAEKRMPEPSGINGAGVDVAGLRIEGLRDGARES